MAFLLPAALAGLGVVAAPVAIHLLNKFRVKVVRWGAMRFLQESLKKNERRLEIEDLILLLLRCLLIALLAFTFAQPVINPGGSGVSSAGGPTMAVLLLDQSASMGQSDGVKTRMELAKAAANKLLDKFGSESQAALFLVTDRVNEVISKPTENLALVRRAIDVAEPGARPGDFLGAIRLALDTLRPFSGAQKEIVILTDGQAVAWKQLEEIKPLLDAAPDVRLRMEPVGGGQGEDNLAITALSPENMVAAAGQLFGCLVEVANYGTSPAAGVRVTLSLNDDAPSDEAVIEKIEPGRKSTVRLNIRFAEAGYQTLRVAIPPDRLPIDNQRAFAVQVVDQLRAAVIEGTRAKTKQDSDGFFLANALVPVPQAARADYFLKVEVVQPSWISDADLGREELIALANVGGLSAAQAKKLRDFVNEGGALFVFPGPNTNPADYNEGPLKDMLPAMLEPLNEPGKKNELAAWESHGYAHPVTAIWNDAKTGSLGSVRASKFYPLKPKSPDPKKPDDPKPNTVVRYSGGVPAVVEWAFGKGRVVLFSSTATTQWNNLPIHPNFVPLVRRLLGYATKRDRQDPLTLQPGAVFQQTIGDDLVGRDFSVVRPDSKGKPRPAGKVELVSREAVVRYRDTEATGAYRIFIGGADRPAAAFAVQMDAQESNLATLPPDRLASLGKLQPAGPDPEAKGTGVRRELWGLLLWTAALVALVEMALAHKFSIAR